MNGYRGIATATIVLIILTIVLAGFAGYFYMQAVQLRKVNSDLKNKIASLNAEKTDLQNKISSLQATVNQLQSDKSYLEGRVRDLENQINTMNKVINLEVHDVMYDDETFNLSPASYISYTIYPGRAGYLILSFSATGNITITVVGSFQGHKYRMSWGRTSGQIIIPILPGRVDIYFRNPSWFFGVTVTFDLTYVY